jgi:hypothetical protein
VLRTFDSSPGWTGHCKKRERNGLQKAREAYIATMKTLRRLGPDIEEGMGRKGRVPLQFRILFDLSTKVYSSIIHNS